MENISKMEMANALFNKPYIKTEKKFFGFKTNVTYTRTNSPVVGICLDYSPTEGQKVKEIVEASPSALDAVVQKKWPSENRRQRELPPESLLFAGPRICGTAPAAVLGIRVPYRR